MSDSRWRSRRSQRHQFIFDACTHLGFEVTSRYQVDPRTNYGLKISLNPTQPDQAKTRRQVGEEIDIAFRAILAPGHAAEHPQVEHPVSCRRVDKVAPTATHAAANGS
jgi:hypothetical protein